jgi:large subunit ribosomal protein L24
MAVKLKIKKGDTVKILAGNDRGKEAEVLKVMPKTSQVIVSGCKLVRKSIKPTEQNPKGGYESKEMPIHISNVAKAEG